MIVFIVMNLISKDGVKLNFKIIGYEFPEITKGFDSNWLLLQIKVEGNGSSFSEKDPSLQTSELKQMTLWMMKMLLGKLKKGDKWSPLENTFTFEFEGKIGSFYKFKLHLSQIFSFQKDHNSLEFMIDDKELSKQIKSLLQYQRLFPIRDPKNCL